MRAGGRCQICAAQRNKNADSMIIKSKTQDSLSVFLCSICLDVFTDPVTIPCGHNFCKTCF
uniref:RING-type domain-containing protein n=1 Tax=Sander lucioperca TaxID=283035 RepID=A0A8D0AFU4_SANLU